jgi:hypothetical protein
MKRILRHRPSPSTALALLALFIAVGGTATAATIITGRQVRDNSLTTNDVRNNSLTHRDVRDRSLLARDFRRGQLPRGPEGPPGASQLQYPVSAPVTVPPGQTLGVSITCPRGTYPTGGDVFGLTIPEPRQIVPNAVTDQGLSFDASARPSGWSGRVHNPTGSNIFAFAEAVCLNVNEVIIPQSSRRSATRPR